MNERETRVVRFFRRSFHRSGPRLSYRLPHGAAQKAAKKAAKKVTKKGTGRVAKKLSGWFSALVSRWFSDEAQPLQGRWREAAGRGDLWLPVCLGSGVALYFGMSAEPPAWLCFLVPVGVGAIGLILRHGPQQAATGLVASGQVASGQAHAPVSDRLSSAVLTITPFLLAGSLGFCLADWRTDRLSAPILAQESGAVTIEGRLLSFEDRDRKRRLVIRIKSIEGLRDGEPPVNVRVTWRGAAFSALPGDQIRLRAVLNTPPSPVMPGAFDFGRQLYFGQIGAVGYALGPPEVIPAQEVGTLDTLRGKVAALRLSLMRRIIKATAARPDGGGIAAALVTGRRDGIPEFATAALRDAGLAHLLAISGLHMGLVMGLMFFVSRYCFASVEHLALRYPIKKWAAVIALAGGAGYLVLSGGAWSARRAFIMAAVMFCAILADRRALSMRNVAIAASIMLVMTPEAILSAGFQMSFAAVIVIIAYAEWWHGRRWRVHTGMPRGRWAKWRRARVDYIVSLSVVSIISGIATGVFAVFHFNHVANYGLIANLLAMPLVSIWVVPMALGAVAAMPLGVDGIFWQLMALGLDIIIAVSVWTQNIPGAVFLTPTMPPLTFYLLIIAGLVFCLLKSAWRWVAVLLLPVAGIPYLIDFAPHVLVGHEGRNIAIRLPAQPGYALLSRQRGRFAAETWLRRAGHRPQLSLMPRIEEAGTCDPQGCVMKTRGGHRIAVSNAPKTLDEDCARADLVIALYTLESAAGTACAAHLIRAPFGRNDDTLSVRITRDGGVHIDRVHSHRRRRPWAAAYGGRE